MFLSHNVVSKLQKYYIVVKKLFGFRIIFTIVQLPQNFAKVRSTTLRKRSIFIAMTVRYLLYKKDEP